MDLFQDVQYVRLRSRELGTYLRADKDGLGVSLRRRRASMKVAWAVHIYNVYGGEPCVRLHSAAYGRYLASMNFRVEQTDYQPWEAEAIMWQAVRTGSGDDILLRHAGELFLRDAGGLCLRANRRPGRRNDGVGMDDINSVSTMRHWVVERIPATENAPRLPAPNWFRLPEIFSFVMPKRVIRYQVAGVDEPDPNPTFVFYGRSVLSLRRELASRLGLALDVPNLGVCVRAGVHGRRTPLVVNLPRPRKDETLDIVLVLAGTQAYDELRYPDVNAAE